MNYFEYNGVSSLDMGLRIESKDVFSSPEYEVDFISIPGRDGNLIAGPGRYANVQVTYSVFLPAKTQLELAQKITAVKQWLFEEPDRYHDLVDSYDPDFFRSAVYAGKLEIEDELRRIGVFTISFSCKPFRYSHAGVSSSRYTGNSISLTNPYIFPSKPYIRLYGSGEAAMTIQSAGATNIWRFTDIDSYIEIDSELMNFYKATEPKNDTVEGSGFPTFSVGANTITFSGGITEAVIQPRWVTL